MGTRATRVVSLALVREAEMARGCNSPSILSPPNQYVMAVILLLLVVLVAGGYFFSDRHHDLYHSQGHFHNPYYSPQPHYPPQAGYDRPGSGFGPLLFVIIMGLVAWLIFNSPSENTQEGPKVNQVEYPDHTLENRAPAKRLNEAPNNAPAQEPRQYASPVLQ